MSADYTSVMAVRLRTGYMAGMTQAKICKIKRENDWDFLILKYVSTVGTFRFGPISKYIKKAQKWIFNDVRLDSVHGWVGIYCLAETIYTAGISISRRLAHKHHAT